MHPTLLEFNASILKEFQIKPIAENPDVGELISGLNLLELSKVAKKVGRKIKYIVNFDDEKTIEETIETNSEEFIFTMLLYAWKINYRLSEDNLVTFGIDFEGAHPDQTIKVNEILNIGTSQNILENISIASLKIRIFEFILTELKAYLPRKGINNRVAKSFSGDSIIIYGTKSNTSTIVLGLMIILSLFGFVACMANLETSNRSYSEDQVIEDAIKVCKAVVSDPWNCKKDAISN